MSTQHKPWLEPLPGLLRQSLEGQYEWLTQLMPELRAKSSDPDVLSRLVDSAVQLGMVKCGLMHDDTLRAAAELPERKWSN